MVGRKVVYLDEYRKKRLNRQKNLLEMIEVHLAEAGLLEKNHSIHNREKVAGALAFDKAWPNIAVEEDAG